MAYDYDIVVIGGGISGFVSAVTARGLGKRVALIEKRKLGGNCTNFTCIPSKALIHQAHLSREISRLYETGLAASPYSGPETGKVMSHVRAIVRMACEKDTPETFEEMGIEVLYGTASFIDGHRVRFNGDTISSGKFIVAAGTLPLIPPVAGLEDTDYLTNESIFQLDSLPASLIILGGGVAGMEFASAFGRLGVQTTVIEAAPRFLPAVDRELVNRLLQTLTREDIRLLPGTRAEKVRKEKIGSSLIFRNHEGGHGEIRAERILVSIGRKPDIEGLGLENAGVTYTGRGIRTDETLRTSAANIYACGDVAGPHQLASMAEYQAIVATRNALLPFKSRVDYSNNVYVIYTEPPIAFLGVTEEHAHRRLGHRLEVYRFDYGNMRRALTDGMQTGVAKILCDHRGYVIGAHIFGEAAAEVIHEIQVIASLRKPLYRINAITHAYPTYAQAVVGRASQLAFLDRMGRNVFVKAVLKLLPGFDNRLATARRRLAESDEMRGKMGFIRSTEQEERRKQIRAISTRARGGDCIIALPADIIDYDESPMLAACSCSGITEQGSVILDFGRVRRINGLGAAMLIKLQAHIRGNRRLAAFDLPTGVVDVFRITGLDAAIPVYGDEAGAATGRTPRRVGRQDREDQGVPLANRQNWARPIERLGVSPPVAEARNLNVSGRRIVSPVHGFGQLWQKVFRLYVADPDVSPEEAIAIFKQNFGNFQPVFNRFFPSERGLIPGEVVPFDSFTPGGPISTAVVVLYSDDTSFTFITPQGHPEAGMVSFSAGRFAGKTIVEIVGVARAGDPLYEAAFLLIGSRIQSRIWCYVLTSLAVHLGVPADIGVESKCVDPGRQWTRAGSLWHNAQVRTLLAEPTRWPHSIVRRVNKWQMGRPGVPARTTQS